MSQYLKKILLALISGILFLILPQLLYAQAQAVKLIPPDNINLQRTAVNTDVTADKAIEIGVNTRQLTIKAQEEQRARIVAERAAQIRNRWGFAFGQALINALNFFTSRIAYDAASDLAGYKQEGYEPRIHLDAVTEYLEKLSLDSAGEFLGSIQKSNWKSDVLSKKFNFDFCAPDLRIRYNILLQLFHEVEPRPKCTWNQIRASGQAFWDRWTGPQAQQTALSLVGFQLQPGQTDLSLNLALNDRLVADSRDKARAGEVERIEGRGFRGVLSPISKKIKTPAATIEDNVNFIANELPLKTTDISTSAFLFQSDVWAGLGANAASVFTNTLLEKFAQRIIKGLVPDIPVPELTIPEPGTELSDAAAQTGAINVKVAYGDLLKPTILQFSNYNPLTEFTTCDSFARGAKNCVIDQKFAQAINEHLTVREALQKDYLHANLPLHYAGGSKNVNPNCYLTGYCESNLKKLRAARIIPIGWEIAAAKSSDDYPITLGEVIANFDNPQSRWYRLIDPDWLLKLPLTQCQAMVYGATRLAADSSGREQVCVDAPTCIEEDEKGNCIGGYGYCSREKNVWKLGGDICPAQYASCLTLQPRKGPAVNYLLDTIDKKVCIAENVGCKGYSLTQATDSSWPVTPAVYLDKDAPACDSKDAGCTELVSKKFGVALNLLNNASFEKDADNNLIPDGWSFGGQSSSYFYTPQLYTNNSFIGDRAIHLPANNKTIALNQTVSIISSTIHTVSVYAKRRPESINDYQIHPSKLKITLPDSLSFFGLATNCEVSSDGKSISLAISATANYERFSCVFTTPQSSSAIPLNLTAYSENSAFSSSGSAAGAFLDAIQLEEGPGATPFLESGYGSVQKAYLKVAPDYLNCALDDARAQCQKYASICLPEEVGCELYAPQDGDPAVPGIVGSGDRCPAECVGYSTFKQEPTNFEVANFPLYFIPKSGQACNAKAIGCDEFTNLEALSTGGENREYFSSIRSCQKPASDSATFYTWEGSDTVGYQLKSWNLKKSNQDSGPCTRLNPVSPNQCADDGIVGVCTASELATNPDCREFYDQAGNIYRRLYSKTIVSSADCKPFRKTDSNQTNCQVTGGAWNATAGTCVYNIYRPESGQCSTAEAGCRAYTGNAGKNIFTVFSDTFSDKTAGAWQGGAPSSESIKVGDSSLTSETNLLVRDLTKTPAQVGKTYLLEFWSKGISKAGGLKIRLGGTNLPEAHFAGASGKPKVDLGTEWQEYRLGPLEVSQENMIDDQLLTISNFNLIFVDNIVLREVSDNIYLIKNSWVTPASCDQTQGGTPLPQAMLGCEEYKDRASTPNYLKSFDRLCREKAVGCEAFINTYNSAEIEQRIEDMGGVTVTIPRDKNVYLVNDKKFACTQEVAGCSALGEHKINQVCTLDNVCVNNNGCNCTDDGASCTVLKNERSCSFKRPPGTVETKYVLNQPDKYSETLCKVAAEGCEAYTYTQSGQVYYFKTPESQLCEFKEISSTSGALVSRGWFKKGTTDPCSYAVRPAQNYKIPYLINGTEYGIWKNGDNMFEGYVGECQVESSMCTKFEDSFDKSSLYPQGKPYYYLKNDKISAGDCGSAVNPKDGCILLRDNSISNLTYNTELTYSQAESVNRRVPPVNCDVDPASCSGKKNDANSIIKVKQDRACTDWLTCKTSTFVFDPTTNQPRELCFDYERCVEYSVLTSGAVCTKFAPLAIEATLSEAIYAARDISYRGEEYSGFSAPGLQHVATMDITSGGKLDVGQNLQATLECRGYPESESPFPSYLAEFDPNNQKIITYKQGWSGVNICSPNNPNECQCDYYKADYRSGETIYHDLNKELTRPGLCRGGARDGLPCIPEVESRSSYFKDNWSCGAVGTCEPLERLDSFLGLKGFCLEKDKSLNINGQKDQFNCLLWYPGNISSGGRDIYNYFEKAGFSPLYSATGGRFYCAQADAKNEICTQLVDVGKPQERVYAHTSLLLDSAASEINRKFADKFPPFGSAEPRLFTPAQTPDIPWVTFNSSGIEQSCILAKSDPATINNATCLNEDGCICHQALTPVCTISLGESSCTIPLKTSSGDDGWWWWDGPYFYRYAGNNPNSYAIDSWTCNFQVACNNPAGCECKPNKYCKVTQFNNSCEVKDPNTDGGNIPCGPQYDGSVFKDEEFGCETGGCVCETKLGSCKVEKDQTSCQISRSLIYGGTSITKENLSGYGDTLKKLFGYVHRFFQYATSTKSYSNQNCKDSDLDAPYPCIDAVNVAGQQLTGIPNMTPSLLPQPPIVKYVNQSGLLTALLSSKSDLGLTVNNVFNSDAIIFKSGGVLSSEIKFAFFTKDHGPITGLKIDWEGDEAFDFKTSDSKYKNKVPSIIDNNGEVIAQSCSLSDFGGSEKACESQAASFRHTYLYDVSDTANCNYTDAHFDLGIAQGKKHCHFKPRVQVMDNWGYCNGDCPGGVDGSNTGQSSDGRCFDADKKIFGNSAEQECSNPGAGDTPWTAFKGLIIVAP